MTLKSDEDDAMVRLCYGKECDDTMTMVRWNDGDEAMLYRTIVITSSHLRAIDFLAHALFEENGDRTAL